MTDDISASKLNIATISQPYRQFQKETKERNRKECVPTQAHSHVSAVQTNWFTPFLWQQILWAGQGCQPLMCPCDIVKLLKLKWPSLFGSLTSQVVGSWIDRTTSPRWSEKILRLAEMGNRPQSHSKRAGILVRTM